MLSLLEVLQPVRGAAWSADEPVLLLGFRPGAGGGRRFRTLSADDESRIVPALLDPTAWVAIRSGTQITFGGVPAYFLGPRQLATMARDEDG
jgi:hypothetical protein